MSNIIEVVCTLCQIALRYLSELQYDHVLAIKLYGFVLSIICAGVNFP